MAEYPELITEYSRSPRRAGIVDDANAVGTAASFACGSFVRFGLSIDPLTREILDVRFVSNGCGFAVAASETLSENVHGKNLTELHGLDAAASGHPIGFGSDDLPPERAGCREMVIEALKAALADFRARQIEEFQGETPLVCTCFGVSEDEIDKIISEVSPDTADKVADVCNAGNGCGSCRMLIQSMIDTQHQSGRR